MKNFVQMGDTIEITAPAGGLTSGQGTLAGALFGVSVADYAVGVPAQIKTHGVFTLPKTSAQAWTVGAKVYWTSGGEATTTASGNTLIGCAAAAAANPSDEGQVRLNGTVA